MLHTKFTYAIFQFTNSINLPIGETTAGTYWIFREIRICMHMIKNLPSPHSSITSGRQTFSVSIFPLHLRSFGHFTLGRISLVHSLPKLSNLISILLMYGGGGGDHNESDSFCKVN